MKLRALLLVTLVTLPLPARAEEQVPALVQPVLKSEPAPFSGLLVPEERFKQFLLAEAKVKDQKPCPTCQQSSCFGTKLAFWGGVLVGVVGTGLAVYGGAALVKASK